MEARRAHQGPAKNSVAATGNRLWGSRWFEASVVALFYSLLAVIATYPAVRFLGSRLIGAGDTVQNLWNLWWMRRAVSLGNIFPFYTTMLYHPAGVSLAYHALAPFNGWLSVLLQAMLGMDLVLTFNTIALLTFVASGLSTFVLVRSVTGSSTAAFVSGLVFVFSPSRMSRVYFGNLEMYSTQFIPLLAWFLIRMGHAHQWRDATGAAVALSLTAWCSLELAFGAGILLVFLFAFDLYGARQLKQWKMRLKRWLLVGLLTCVLCLPVILPMVRNYQVFQDQADQFQAAMWNSADLLGFFVPDNVIKPLIRRVASFPVAQKIGQIYATFYGNPCEKTVFLGYGVLVMTAISVFATNSAVVCRWLMVAAAFFVLCLGPVLYVAGNPVCPMPYNLFLHLPLVKFGRTPSRLAVFLMLALAIMVGHGCATLERRWSWFKWVTILIGVLIFAEFLIIPLRLDSCVTEIPAYYYQLAEEDQDDAILDVPIDLFGAQGPAGEYMLYQIVHQKPIVGGYISRTPGIVLQLFERPFLYQLRARIYDDAEPYSFSPDAMAQGLDDLRWLDVRYVILHKDLLPVEDAPVVRKALVALLSDPEYEGDVITVWRIDLTQVVPAGSPARGRAPATDAGGARRSAGLPLWAAR